MPFNFYDTHTLLMAVQQLVPAATFLRDRYFPTNDASDIFATEDVLVEYRDGTRKLAPFVAPRKGGVTILRKGYNMERYTPPFVAPRRTLTLDELKEVAAAYGVDASAMRKKADVIAAIEKAKAAANEVDDDQTGDNEEPPQIGAADPV